ncbi:cobalamin-binding protein [Domibacillus mangrovi]|uniref:Cobalamin-binding protein n=1 Tax=Domibacillus mangrovi TaxID=1714354 RepID=A0A1Q5P6E4_9BACI|nr:cobalamin-binding protein [Domibacillus mangrovi]OKL37748.1 cobalamin-binding protein [Domibacillus mangrovi]
MRIVSICPSNTEVCEYLGIEDQIVGVDDYSDLERVRLGPDLSIDMEKLEAVKPDIVLASLSVPGMEKNVAELERRGIPHIVTNPNSLDDIGMSIMQIGEACGVNGSEAKQRWQQSLDMYRSRNWNRLVRVYWEWWPKPVFTPGRANWLTEMSALCGAENVFADHEEASVQTDWETVVSKKPDILLLAWVGVMTDKVNTEVVKKRSGYEGVPIYVMEEKYFCRPSPQLLVGLEQLDNVLNGK